MGRAQSAGRLAALIRGPLRPASLLQMLWRICFALGAGSDSAVDRGVAIKRAQNSGKDEGVHRRGMDQSLVYYTRALQAARQLAQDGDHGFDRLFPRAGSGNVERDGLLNGNLVSH